MIKLVDLKSRYAELRTKMNSEKPHITQRTFRRYSRISQWLHWAERKLLVSALLLLLFSGGCVENTMREAGHVIQAGGRLVTGVGTDWTRAANGYANEK